MELYIESSEGKFGKNKTRDSLRKKTQRAKKIYKFIEQVGLDKIKYIKSYSATSISKLTNEQIQEVIDYGIFSEKLLLVTDHVTEISETSCSRKNLPKNTPSKTEEFQNNQISALIPSTHNSNSSNNSSGTSPVQMISPATPQASVSPISIPRTNPTYNRSYFCNKTLDQYPNV
ncbi:hypothetical protein RirG_113330 [Rhizophagus irregularis DAOM 197198w]|uniref:Uncharacterized protein n=1 Tax=Rhizophagus irregularis (strain DAOM 197198w) TaxID=1432141 RepID=A0A015JDJ3_RHIIW|nr:hypothetical protein RirG_113330 [Rhizophagus irregularis DAOM 197198w]